MKALQNLQGDKYTLEQELGRGGLVLLSKLLIIIWDNQ